MTLTTKIQYKNFEPGEFTDKKERSYEETIQLIQHFPWEEQRTHLQVSLTNPSITLEDKEGNFLKLALYYEGKFVLHYLTTQKQLYTKSLPHVEDAYPSIRSFFETNPFDTAGFRLENSWIQGKAIHFKDQDFQYRMNPVKFWIQSLLYTTFLLFYLIAMLGLLISAPARRGYLAVPLVVSLAFLGLIVVMALTLAVLFNHYRTARGKILIISRGNDIFYYGDENNPEQYDKKDITKVIIVGPNNSRTEYTTFVNLEMGLITQGLHIPGMLIPKSQLLNKLPGYPQMTKNKWFSFIPTSS